MAGVVEGPFRYIVATTAARRKAVRLKYPTGSGLTSSWSTVKYRKSFINHWYDKYYNILIAEHPFAGSSSQTLTEMIVTAAANIALSDQVLGGLPVTRYLIPTTTAVVDKTVLIRRADGGPIAHYEFSSDSNYVGFFVYVIGWGAGPALDVIVYEATPDIPKDTAPYRTSVYIAWPEVIAQYQAQADAANALIPSEHVHTFVGPGGGSFLLKPVIPNVADWANSTNGTQYYELSGEIRSIFMTFSAVHMDAARLRVTFDAASWGREEKTLTSPQVVEYRGLGTSMTPLPAPPGFTFTPYGGQVMQISLPAGLTLSRLSDTFSAGRQTLVAHLVGPSGEQAIEVAYADAPVLTKTGFTIGTAVGQPSTVSAEPRPSDSDMYHTVDRRLVYPFTRIS